MAEETQQKIQQLEDKVKELETAIEKVSGLDDKIKEVETSIEKHKHSGQGTYDISAILNERLGIKIGTITGAAEAISFDIAGILTATGRAAVGQTAVWGFKGIDGVNQSSFGITWSGGGEPYFFIDNAEFVVPSFASDPTAIVGSIYYNTATNSLKAYINGAWKTLSYT